MDLRKLRQFLVIAESPSLSRAAERLHIAQPALTQAMKALEQELGVALIEHADGDTAADRHAASRSRSSASCSPSRPA